MGSGLSKKDPNCPELKYCTLTGLYPDCSWDPKIVKKFVLEKKLAPIYTGSENSSEHVDALEKILEECPICFLYYPSLNRASCCRQGICTECFLQIKPNINSPVSCPFCNRPKFSVFYSGPLSKEEKVKELEEQQKVTELQIKIQLEQDRERAYSLPTHFDRAKELQQEEIRSRRESVNQSSARSSTTTTTQSLDQYSQSAPSLANNLNFGRSPRSSNRSSNSVAEEGGPFFDDWSGLADEAEIEEILLREAIQLSLQGRPASQSSGRTEAPQIPPSRSPGPGTGTGTGSAGGGAGSSGSMVNNSRIGGAAS